MKLSRSALLLFLGLVSVSYAADRNGYTAHYECRAGGPACNVNIAQVAAQSCQQTIAPSTPWSSINWSNDVICIQAGDHTAKGTLTIGASGAVGRPKVLRYYSAGDDGSKPWNQSGANRAILKRIQFAGGDNWVIYRLAVDGGYNNPGIGLIELPNNTSSENIVFDSILVERTSFHGIAIDGPSHNGVWVQNSVVRNCIVQVNNDNSGIWAAGAPRQLRFVNNEIYDCTKNIYISEHGSSGAVSENNDLYVSPAIYTDCRGNYNGTGPCAAAELPYNTKGAGSSSDPVLVFHNRIWGSRYSDLNLCCAGGTQGAALSLATNPNSPAGSNYTLVKNNIIMDSQQGAGSYWSSHDNNSFIGNIFYDLRQHNTAAPSYAFTTTYMNNTEFYLNTIVNVDSWFTFSGSSHDVMCNMVVNSGAATGTPDGGTQVISNAFYGTPAFSTANSETTIARSNAYEANSTEYCFYRKLQTGAEQVCIPNVKSTASSPHYQKCDASIGTRTNRGINNDAI